MNATRTSPPRPGRQEVEEQTGVGTAYLASLMRAQRRSAAAVLGPLTILLVGLPLLFALWPDLAAVQVFGVPLGWAVPGALVFPLLFGLAVVHVRQSERAERAFGDLLGPR